MRHLVLLALAACASGPKATPTDSSTLPDSPLGVSEPVAEISAPAAGAVYRVGEDVPFSGTVADSEDAPEALNAWWESSQDGRLDDVDSAIDGQGGVLGAGRLTEGAHQILLVVEDTDGRRGTARVDITVLRDNTAPVATIDQPADGAIVDEGASVAFAGTVVDLETASPALTLTWTSSVDGVLWSAPAAPDGATGFSTDVLTPGLHQIVLRAEDEAELAGVDVVDLLVTASPVPTDSGTTDTAAVTDSGTPWSTP